MAYNKNDQNESPLPGGSENPRRTSSQHLPRYFRTQVNNKFLASTLDQLMQPGTAEKLNGYYGREEAKGRQAGDYYIGDVSKSRNDYQLEPVSIIKDSLNNVNFYGDYNDYINQLRALGSTVEDHSVINQDEYYAWNPHISWDKFVNFREYYWLPNGPQTVQIVGQTDEVVSTFKVKVIDNGENYGFVFTPDGLTQNPTLTLYRGIKYRFEIDAEGNPLSFRTRKETAASWRKDWTYSQNEKVNYNGSIYLATVSHHSKTEFEEDNWYLDTSFNLTSNISAQSVDKGVIELTVDSSTPNIIYYMSDSDVYASGVIDVKDIVEATSINVEQELLGLQSYTTGSGYALSNGMKVKFAGNVIPKKYSNGSWYVEGVGDSINLISEEALNIPSEFTKDLTVQFDAEGFDRLPFSEAIGYPVNKDYITINRSSLDGNLWSKYNRWFHRSVIEQSAKINNQDNEIDEAQRASRPIIEFNSGLKLFNFGTAAKSNVDLVDTFTKDVFSNVEGALGYNVDGIDLTNGMRVVFIADTDPLVTGRIFEVKFITINNRRQITLVETDDSLPVTNETILCTQGTSNKGKVFWYNGTSWTEAQRKTKLHQSPLFSIYDKDGIEFSDTTVYESSTFEGTTLFEYKQGTGTTDSELGFPISYRSIENVGDIAFNFALLSDAFTYIPLGESPVTTEVKLGYLRKYSAINTFEIQNGWKKAEANSSQPVIRQYIVDNSRTFYTVDAYEQSGTLTDLWLKVYVNNALKFKDIDYTTEVNAQNDLIIRFNTTLSVGDNIIIKTKSKAVKKPNVGKYEIVKSLERNPLNTDINEFTLGEVNDHVGTIVEEVESFAGVFPGVGNLRDLGNLSKYGKRIVKHASPLNLPLYHILDKEANVVKSLKFARREYGKFKRSFLKVANSLGFSGPVKQHVDLILQELVKDKIPSMPFYFSDMSPFGAANISNIEIEEVDSIYFALSEAFDLTTLSSKAVHVYQNGLQLMHGSDYTFNDQGFVVINTAKEIGDIITIYEYENTNGCFIPPTPTKLGLFPKFEPLMFQDDTYLETQTVIQGHDGSITIAFGDFRDDLILELEKRIFNNLKKDYDTDMFDIYNFLPGHSRTTGLTTEQINSAMLSDFVQWMQLVDDDYTINTAFNRADQFTFNHTGMEDVNGNTVHGWWRAVYKFAYDTDRPHTHPWEMLGFTVKPTWWDTQYGEAPYTSNNFLMWEDIEAGVINEPNKSSYVNKKFKRNGLTSHLPVDESGNLINPILSSFIVSYNTTDLNANFAYGDHSPVETAWRRSSEYPFALITSLLLNQPSKVMSTCFDRERQVRDTIGDIVYVDPNRQLKLVDLQFPNTIDDTSRVFTSGLVNYIYDYLTTSITSPYTDYTSNVKSINNQIGFRVAGYTNKDKFKLILDSRSPTNNGNVFIPEENYKVFLSVSAPVQTVFYSGVIVEKQSYGFIVRGYNNEQPFFNINTAQALANDPIINVGSVSTSYVQWDSNKTYVSGSTVEYQNSYYRVSTGHVSGPAFDPTKFTKLPKLPEEGGAEAYFRTAFRNIITKVPYGTVYKTLQEVVDFLLGYSHYLESQGFVFDYYSDKDEFVSNWKTSARELMFWSTQNWNAGSVITLSPGAFQLKFKSKYSVVDDIYDTFYGYSLLKSDGKKLKTENVSLTRENPNEFVVRPKATEDGIFAVRLALVQKEHAVIIDNKTVFGDIIYDQEPGYRQERIRVLGYRTADWDGSINIPGFVFDNAKVTEWKQWQDYSIGDLVKYKEFFYTARNKVSGTTVFDADQWVRLVDEPKMELIPNFEYKVNQFADFYDLDTDNFDLEQQKFAQHLIGYQNREYLANIINDDVSQYKFYQGMLQDKGTKNALTKLFDVLSSANKESLEFYEEWAIKVGQYGAAEGFEEVEYLLDETQFKLEPQSIELVNTITGDETDLVYRIRPFEAYLSPNNYNHAPFPSKYVYDTYTKNNGYVNPQDVDFIVDNYDSILNIDYSKCVLGNLIWVGNVNRTWDIFNHSKDEISVVEAIENQGNGQLVTSSTPFNINENDIIGIEVVFDGEEGNTVVNGFYKVSKIENTVLTLAGLVIEDAVVSASRVSRLVSVRVETPLIASNLIQENPEVTKVWIDEDANYKWGVRSKTTSWNLHQTVPYTESTTNHSFGSVIGVDGKNTVLAAGAPDDGNGKVYIYSRAGNGGSYQITQVIEPDLSLSDSGMRYGSTLDISDDGKYLVVGAPDASNVKTSYRSDFEEEQSYSPLDIVRYQDALWKANVTIQPKVDNIEFGSFESVPQIMTDLSQTEVDDVQIPVILTGDYPFTNVITDHFIVKAPLDMYAGSGIGDAVEFVWNDLTYANQSSTSLTSIEPFGGNVEPFTKEYLSDKFIIAQKIDAILYIENSNTVPLDGQIVESTTGFGTVAYRFNPTGDDARLVIYISDLNGTFGKVGSLTTSIGEYVGEYITAAPTDVAAGAETKWGGYWRFATKANSTYNVVENNLDYGRGLIINDVIPASTIEADPTLGSYNNRYYYNILNYATDLISSKDTIHSEITTLSYAGNPGPAGVNATFGSQLYVLKAPKLLTDSLTAAGITQDAPGNPQVDVFLNTMPAFLSGYAPDVTTIGLTNLELNKKHTVYDVWDGYIDILVTKNDSNDQPLEPKIGLTVQDVTNLGTAEVVFYQKFDNANIRLYLKGISGNWAKGLNFGENREIQWISDGSGDPYYDPAIGFRVFGQIQERSFPLDAAGIGKMIVLKAIEDIPLSAASTIFDAEYWFYDEQTVQGIPRLANLPSNNNNDWEEVFNLPLSATGISSGLTNEGYYSIYQRSGVGQFVKLNSYTVADRANDSKLSADVKFAKSGSLGRLFIKTAATDVDPGRIYIILNGQANNTNYGWEFSADKNYRGEFSNTRSYFEDNIVYLDSVLYTAETNIAPGEFNPSDWNEIINPLDYLGYIPNTTGNIVGVDSSLVYDPINGQNGFVIDTTNLSVFAKSFDVSKSGDVIVVSASYTSDTPNAVFVYRNVNGSFYKAQTIESPNKTTAYGDNVAISNDGKLIAVSAAFDDTAENDSGKVYIYAQVDGVFELQQELYSLSKERAELFGWTIDFDGNQLLVGSRNGDSFVETNFSDNTTFDGGFTRLRSYDKDAGIVRLYERQGNILVYAETIDYDADGVRFFGRNIKLKNNHIYVGLPQFQRTPTRQGVLLDYRIPDNTKVWSTLRAAKDTVDVNKIKRVMLYDVAKSEIVQYLDYIDVLQGKIAGPAEQELTYKTYYDPAVYSAGISGNIDPTNSWGESQTGQLWWNLTNAKFLNPYQDNVIFSTNSWNLPATSINTIDVFEWVESDLLPSEWDLISGTDEGISQGITGTSRSGDDAYVVKRLYDNATGTFSTRYYFWVLNKTTIPNVDGRLLSATNVANLISNPQNEGYRFVSFISPTQLSLTNCDDLIRNKDIALSVQYWTIDNQEINIHNQYQVITEGLETSVPNIDIERKWIDSLVGFDTSNRAVPATELSPKEKYGTLNSPRQGWFVNREEALNQAVKRINGVLLKTLIIDDKDISSLTQIDQPPSVSSNRFDRSIETLTELQFVGVARASRATIEPIIENGKIVRVTITDGGRGYITAPLVTVLGKGQDAVITTEINSAGQVISATVLEEGQYYDEATVLSVRRYTVLVESDNTLNGKWALYERDTVNKEWILVESQAYDVVKYWDYIDWYDTGVNAFTEIDFIIDFPYDLPSINDEIGDVVKIKNVGTGGWLLLEKINNETGVDYSVNYKTIGRENGTIQFKDTLYDVQSSLVGFDTTTYDVLSFDALPSAETRIVLETIRDKIFIDDLAIEWNNLFFASIRYVFSEQGFVDWAFKTSFIKAKHNVGNLEQSVNFKNDNLESYEAYIEEVKPYKTKIREYLSSYESLDNSQTVTSDFDLPARFEPTSGVIQPQVVKVVNDAIQILDADITTYPNKNWADNVGFKIAEIKLADAGKGYTNAPIIKIEGSGTGATAVASLGRNGTISAITVTNSGVGYLTAPTVTIDGTVNSTGTLAKAVAILGNTPIRTMTTAIKFDRVSGIYEFVTLDTVETFNASGLKVKFDLNWPLDLRTTKIKIFKDNEEVLGRKYTYRNVLDQTKEYDRYLGQVEFFDPPAAGSVIKIEYFKDTKLLKAQDRVNLTYDPQDAQFGNTLGQLMEGVDYGGVEVSSFGFAGTTGWDAGAWFAQGWDIYDTTFEDEIFQIRDDSTRYLTFAKPLETGVTYNVYKNGIRIDAADWDPSVPSPTNPTARMLPITGAGQTGIALYDDDTEVASNIVVLDEDAVPTNDGDVLIFRKTTSDGSFIADPESYDSAIDGGNLAYSNATGLRSEDINIDGDGFVTPTTSKGPEEVVPGQVMDTLDIQVFEKPMGGASQITSLNYIGNGVTKVFNIGSTPGKKENLFVKVGNQLKTNNDFAIDFVRKEIVFNTAPIDGSRVNIVNVGLSAASILDIDNYIGDGATNDFLTNARWEDNATAYVTVDGVTTEVALIKSDESYAYPNNFIISFPVTPRAGANIRVLLAVGGIDVLEQYSQVTVDTLTADGSTMQFDLTSAPFEQQPESAYTLVKVNNRILSPGYSERFEVTNSRQYQLDLTQIPVGAANAYDLAVYLNGTEIEYIQSWTYEGAGIFDSTVDPQSQPGSTITLEAGIGDPGDVLTVFVLTDGEYRMGYYESDNTYVKTPGVLHLDSAYSEGDVITVYQFSNHNSQGFERQVITVEEKTELTIGTPQYYKYNWVKQGYIKLRKPAIDAQYVWVILNGELLSPNIEYTVTGTNDYVRLQQQPNEGDVIQILHFGNSVVTNKFGFRIFKDILNRVHYKRLEELYELAQPLNWYDTSIHVVDASDLPNPEYNTKYPGVIFIEGERIEYFGRNDNELLQLRRGTLGTGVKETYATGSKFMEQGRATTIPYKDTTNNISVTAGGYSLGSTLYENSINVTVTNIEYDFNNNTAFPLGGQVCTVTGTGFTDRAEIYVGETQVTTTFVSETKLTFITPALPVGAYDLIVVNPFTNVPIDTPQTSYVANGAIKYVQVLLPFAPIPNPASAVGWYKDTIPEEYWEAQDIEVIVAGRRLRKTPIDLYTYTAQDSPEGDTQVEAEYAVNKAVGAYVRLTTPPPQGTTVNIIRKIGTNWSEEGSTLAQSNSDVAKFLREKTTDLPR